MPLICEGIVTTRNEDGTVNVSPMGPTVDREFSTLMLRPFPSSRTFGNLCERPRGVFHVVDDVELLARAATGQFETEPGTRSLAEWDVDVLVDACHWYAFEVDEIAEVGQRRDVKCRILQRGIEREFFGFNRAMFAVLEAAILATRLHILESDFIESEIDRLQVLLDKTGGDREHQAFDFLKGFIASNTPGR